MNSDVRKSGRTIAAVAAGMLILILAIFSAPYFFSGTASAAVIRIPRDATKKIVADTLRKYYGEDFSKRTIRVFSALVKEPAERYGAYRINEGTSPAAAAKMLARGPQEHVSLTINGVRELLPFADRIARKFDFSGDDMRRALADSALLKPYGLTPEQVPALFINDTYYFYWNDTPEKVIKKLGENYLKVWNEERREKASRLGLKPEEIMTVASIVDEETNQLPEKGRVGRLYINRLNKKMKLQADPTVRFALKDFTIKRVTGKHLQAPGPYNTYRVYGLPPGPIRTTSVATIDAILNSEPSDDLYMCAKEDFSGFHNFASDYNEHLANARRYQKALDERGITIESSANTSTDSIK